MPEGATLNAEATHAMEDKSCPLFCPILVSMSPIECHHVTTPHLSHCWNVLLLVATASSLYIQLL